MSAYDPPLEYPQTIFNPSNWGVSTSSTLTQQQADNRYLKLTGGTESGRVFFNAGLDTDGLISTDTVYIGDFPTLAAIELDGDFNQQYGDLGTTQKITGRNMILSNGVSNTDPYILQVLKTAGTDALTLADNGNFTIDGTLISTDGANNRVGINKNPTTYTLEVDGACNLDTGHAYRIAGNSVLNATTLGTGVVNSSLTSLGTLSSLNCSGAVTLSGIANATASNALYYNAGVITYGTAGGGGGSPGGTNTQVQFNDSGAFGGDSGLTYNKTTDTLTIGGGLVCDTNTLIVDATNNRVGIVTTSPTVPLDVTGNALITGQATVTGNLIVDTNTLYVDATNNRVGVLTTSPSYALHVNGDANLSSGFSLRINATSVLSATTLGTGVTTCSLNTYQTASDGNWEFGATNVVNNTNNGRLTAVGPYFCSSGWTAVGTSHTFLDTTYKVNAGNDNLCGIVTIFCVSKGDARTGVYQGVISKRYLNTVSLTQLSKTQSNLTTFTIGNSADSITVSTDANCQCCLQYQGAT